MSRVGRWACGLVVLAALGLAVPVAQALPTVPPAPTPAPSISLPPLVVPISPSPSGSPTGPSAAPTTAPDPSSAPLGPLQPPQVVPPPLVAPAPTPTDAPSGVPSSVPSGAPSSSPSAGAPADAPAVGGKRSETFLTGVLGKDQFDPSGYRLWYAPSEPGADLGIIAKALAKVQLAVSDTTYGQLADAEFSLYKWGAWLIFAALGFLVFSLAIPAALLKPMFDVARGFQDQLIGPAQMMFCAVALTVLWAAILLFSGKLTKALKQIAMSLAILITIGGTFAVVPMKYTVGALNYVSTAAAGVLLAGSGHDPSVLTEPKSDVIDTETLGAAFGVYTNGIQRSLIRNQAQAITFGVILPEACQAAYDQAAAQGLAVDDPNNFKPLLDKPECAGFVPNALRPDGDRVAFAFLLLLYLVGLAIVMALLAWPALRGQIAFVVAVAASGFIIVGLALPGSLRNAAGRYVMKIFLGLLATIGGSLALALVLVGMNATSEATRSWATFFQVLGLLIVPVAVLGLSRAAGNAVESRRRQAERSLTGESSRPNADVEALRNRGADVVKQAGRGAVSGGKTLAVTAAEAAATGASGGAWLVGTGVLAAGAGLSKGGKRALFGNDERAGLLAGPANASADAQPVDLPVPSADAPTEPTVEPAPLQPHPDFVPEMEAMPSVEGASSHPVPPVPVVVVGPDGDGAQPRRSSPAQRSVPHAPVAAQVAPEPQPQPAPVGPSKSERAKDGLVVRGATNAYAAAAVRASRIIASDVAESREREAAARAAQERAVDALRPGPQHSRR